MDKILLLLAGVLPLILLLFFPVNVYASFCLFNCEAQDLAKKLEVHADCLSTQISAGAYGRTSYGTDDLSSDGTKVQIDGVWYDEKQLRDEWKANPEKHKSNCYFVGDVTPQEVEKVYQESLK